MLMQIKSSLLTFFLYVSVCLINRFLNILVQNIVKLFREVNNE